MKECDTRRHGHGRSPRDQEYPNETHVVDLPSSQLLRIQVIDSAKWWAMRMSAQLRKLDQSKAHTSHSSCALRRMPAPVLYTCVAPLRCIALLACAAQAMRIATDPPTFCTCRKRALRCRHPHHRAGGHRPPRALHPRDRARRGPRRDARAAVDAEQPLAKDGQHEQHCGRLPRRCHPHVIHGLQVRADHSTPSAIKLAFARCRKRCGCQHALRVRVCSSAACT